MNTSFLYQVPTYLIALLLFSIMLLCNWLGFTVRKWKLQKNNLEKEISFGPIESSLLGLLALLLAFTFGMSASRYEDRKHIIVEEANNIGTAALRCDMYPDSIKQSLKILMKEYVKTRIHYYQSGADLASVDSLQMQTTKLSNKLWAIVMAAAQNPDNILRSQQMIPAMNNMIDIVTTQSSSRKATVPNAIFWLLFILIFCAAFLIGFSNNGKKINYVLVCTYSLMTALTVFLILDLDRPSRGIIKTKNSEQAIMALSEMFK